MEVKYQDIRVDREYVIRGINGYKYYPRMVVRVLQQPPPFSPAGNFYPHFQVRVLQIIGPSEGGIDPLYGNSIARDTQPGKVITVYWRNNSWGDPWNSYGLSWRFSNVALEPLPSNIADKTRTLQELKAIPSNPHYPGGSDFLALTARYNQIEDLDGGKSYFKPRY
jgi:hypothetical protein